ncbi:MAG: hypothetical protein JST55_04055 [Bacteroidetes bacterium]|nr:hypothetical protein [Bacteroidota bacterium]
MKSLIIQRLESLEKHFEKNRLLSYDPYDGLNTPLKKLFLGNKFLERIWLQSIRLFPFNVRGLFGIKKLIHTKSVSDLLSASSILYSKTKDEKYLIKALEYFVLLKNLSIKQNSGIGWGLKFHFTTRFVQADINTPNLFQTVNAVNALLDYYESLLSKNESKKCLEIKNVVDEGLSYILKDLKYTENENTVIWNYWKNLESPIYNVNALMGGFLSRYKKTFNTNEYDDLIYKTIEFLKTGQNSNSSWYYSADSTANFIDGFHTGYILEGLIIAQQNGIDVVKDLLKRGIKYYLKNLFTEQGLPKYYNSNIYPIDGQNCAQAIQTLFYLKKLNYIDDDYIKRTFDKIDSVLWNKNGYYNFMKTKLFTYKTPMDRWVNAPMYLALAHLY